MDIAEDVLTKEDIVKAIGTPPEQIAKASKKISAGNLKHVDDAIAGVHCFLFNDRNILPLFRIKPNNRFFVFMKDNGSEN